MDKKLYINFCIVDTFFCLTFVNCWGKEQKIQNKEKGNEILRWFDEKQNTSLKSSQPKNNAGMWIYVGYYTIEMFSNKCVLRDVWL